MADPAGAGARSNTFALAAVALPVLVAGFFLLASAVPRWTVAPPTHDLLVRVDLPWDQPNVAALDFTVRNGRVVVTARVPSPPAYLERSALFLVDADGGSMRAIPVNAPEGMEAGAAPVEVEVPELAGLQVSSDAVSPDGYQLQPQTYRGRGLVGGLFGMNSRRPRVTLAKSGRVVSIDAPNQDVNLYAPVHLVGWIVGKDGG
ncbi:MAG TPA: hypothetical protein VIY56_18540 [Vicinamibacterales bacterium]